MINWTMLLDQSPDNIREALIAWGIGTSTTSETAQIMAKTKFAGEFRNLVREHGTNYGRRLSRKALRYRYLMA